MYYMYNLKNMAYLYIYLKHKLEQYLKNLIFICLNMVYLKLDLSNCHHFETIKNNYLFLSLILLINLIFQRK
jgi:hypothetical protein